VKGVQYMMEIVLNKSFHMKTWAGNES